MSARPTTAVAVCAALLAGAGCSVVDRPDAAAWDDSAAQALSDATSEVATARLALETAADEHLWSSYTVVLVAQAEEGMGTVQDDLSRLQVPPERARQADRVERLLDRAAALVQDARAHAVDGRYDDRALLARLDRTAQRLERAEAAR